MSILNQMRKNPAITAGAFIFIIALIAVIGWIVNRRKKGSTGSTGGVKPSITFGTSSMILNPNTGNVETYKTEYATENLGQNIDISISWKNGGGFDQSGVNSIIVKRKKGNSYINVSDNSDTKVITTQSFLEDFTDCETIILGDFIGTNDVVGVNTIEVYYTTTVNSTPVLLGSVDITIDQNHLNTTIDLDTVTSITIPPTSGSDIISVLNVPEFTTFNITSVERNRRVAPSVRFEKLADGSIKLKDDDGNIVVLPGARSDSETYIFEKYLDEHYFIKPFGQDLYYIDHAGLHEISLILRTKAEIFASRDSLQKGLFIIEQSETTPAVATGPYHITGAEGKAFQSGTFVAGTDGDLNSCKTQCDTDATCIGFNHTASTDFCNLASAVDGSSLADHPTVQWYKKGSNQLSGKYWLKRGGKMYYTYGGALANRSFYKLPDALWEIIPGPDGKYWLKREGKMFYTSGAILINYGFSEDPNTLWEIIPDTES